MVGGRALALRQSGDRAALATVSLENWQLEIVATNEIGNEQRVAFLRCT